MPAAHRMPIRNPHLRRFWLTFAEGAWPRYVGVTAYTRDEAVALAEEVVGVAKDGLRPQMVAVVEDVDVSTLDPGHVLPNCDVPVWHGVWFPRGYRDP